MTTGIKASVLGWRVIRDPSVPAMYRTTRVPAPRRLGLLAGRAAGTNPSGRRLPPGCRLPDLFSKAVNPI